MRTAAEILEAIGTDDAPTIEELSAARDELAEALRTLAADGGTLDDMREARAALDTTTEALAAATEAEAEAEAERKRLLEGVTDDASDEDDDEDDDEASDEAEPETEQPKVAASVRRALLSVRDREPAPTPVPEHNHTEITLNGERVANASLNDIGEAFAAAAGRVKSASMKVASFKTNLPDSHTLGGVAEANSRKLQNLSAENLPDNASCCSLAEPFSFPTANHNCTPIADSLTTVNAPTGALAVSDPQCIPDMGAAVWTCEDQDLADPEDPLTWKQCYTVECGDGQTAKVEPVYRCAEIDSYTHRFSPSQWADALEKLNRLGLRASEVQLYNQIWDAATSDHTGFATGSMWTNIWKTLGRSAGLIRQDQRLCDAELTAILPTQARDAAREDIEARFFGERGPDTSDAGFAARAALDGLNLVFSDDLLDMEQVQYDGALADYPATMPFVLFNNEEVIRLSGGERDLGIDITDHNMNRQNKISAFWETYQAALVRACNLKRGSLVTEVCDTVPACGA